MRASGERPLSWYWDTLGFIYLIRVSSFSLLPQNGLRLFSSIYFTTGMRQWRTFLNTSFGMNQLRLTVNGAPIASGVKSYPETQSGCIEAFVRLAVRASWNGLLPLP